MTIHPTTRSSAGKYKQSIFRVTASRYKPIVLLITLLLCTSSWAAELQSTVDRNTLAMDETLVLSVRYDGQVLSDPDFSDLEIDFELLSQQQQNQLSIINGNRTSYTTWTIQLLPKRTGKLLIPSFNLKGAVSNAIEINITDTPQNTVANDKPVFIETSIDKSSVYVQEQIILTHQLYTRVNLSSVSSDELSIKNANVIKIAETQYQKNLNGVPHLVVETKYAVFPETNGTLEIPALRYSAVVPDNRDPFSSSFFSRGGRQVFLRSDHKTIEVKPRPAGISVNAWLPSKGLSLTEKWSRPLDQLRVGEPITRTINILAQGLTSVQLPPLEIPEGDGFRLYPDQSQMNDDKNASGVIGKRTESIAIVPTRAGEIRLPAITVNWWDTNTNQMRKTSLESQVLQVLPALGVEPPPTIEDSDATVVSDSPGSVSNSRTSVPETNNWVIALAVSNLILLLIIVLLIWRLLREKAKQSKPFKPETQKDWNEQRLFNLVKQSAREQSFADFQQALINWARSFWNNQHISTLVEITMLAESDELSKRLTEIDEQKYSNHSENTENIDFKSIIKCLEYIRNTVNKAEKSNKTPLKPLYE